MKEIKYRVAAILLVMLLLTGCERKEAQQTVSASQMAEYFGTIVMITLYGTEEELLYSGIEDAFAECERLENIFSAKKEGSELVRLNQSAYDGAVVVSDELFGLIQESLYYNELSEGSFDISVGELIELWGIGTEHQRVPEDWELQPYRGQNGCQYLVLDENEKTIQYTSKTVKIDLGGIAKGYAADKVKECLKEKGITSGILNFGGNVMTIGSKTGGNEWKIGITDPFKPSQLCGTVSAVDRCIVTSGNYERYFIQDGKRYHHILDPDTGYPAENGLVSTTIIGESSASCDALSTACYILGAERALALIEALEDIECVLIDEEGKFYVSSGAQKYHFSEINEQ